MIFLSFRLNVKSILGYFRSVESAILTHLEALNFDFHDFLHRAPKMAKTAILELLDSPKLISRKI